MKERATMTEYAGLTGARRDAKRFGPLCTLGYTISGKDGVGFMALDPDSGKEIRRRNFDDFAKAVVRAGWNKPTNKARRQVASQRLHLLAMERREIGSSKRSC